MNKILQLTLLFWLPLFLYACEQGPDSNYTITGQLQTVHVEADSDDGETPDTNEDVVDWSVTKIVVAQEITNATGETEFVELVSGTFDADEVNLSGNVDHPTAVKISVETDGAEPLTLDAVIAPDASISIVLVVYPADNSASMEFFGASRKVMDPANQFSISGDLSAIDADLESATVDVSTWENDEIGEQVVTNFGTVMLEEGKFVIEADVDEPKFVNIFVWLPASQDYTQFNAIVEPGADIEISSHSSWLHDLFPTSESGKHAQLIDSWRQSEKYLKIQQEYRVAYLEYQNQAQNEEDLTDSDDEETPKYRELGRELSRIRNEHLERVAANAEDPMDALLALEIGAFFGKEEALPIYDRLSKTMDTDLVMRRVTHARNDHAAYLESSGINRSLMVGNQAPGFTLPDLEGEQISLSDLQQKNEFVLVDFWASWCGPCIASFPKLKELYASYSNYGFEIVSISIDDDHDAWAEASEQYELPWINLGELKSHSGEVATSFGVIGIPKTYVLDNNSKIIEKDLSTSQLEDWLAETYKDDLD